MQGAELLRVGYIPYLNCVPFFHHLKTCGFSGEIVSGVPSALNRMLQQGEVDVSPSSSFEYALNWRDYLLFPDFSISSSGPVKSVLLFSPCPLSELQGKKIAITGESATSINLLRILLLEYAGLSEVDDYVPQESVEELIAARKPALLIGDRAMQQARNLPEGVRAYDLGELWQRYTGLPFVFALWILRRDSAGKYAQQVNELQRQLRASLDLAQADFSALARATGARGEEIILLSDYWKGIDYSLTRRHLSGLRQFVQLCYKYCLLAELPEIAFFDPANS